MIGFPFDAVLFDLDGTLVATDGFWPDVARSATLRFFGERGITREVPGAPEWMRMVGLPIDQAFDLTFADLDAATRADLLAACMEEEHAQLARDGAALLPGVAETLTDLAEQGVRLGIASNCAPEYLELMLHRAGLARWIEEGRCLASPGVRDKADMIEDLLHTFGTRSAVMVGDRPGDRDAAWENGLPHVHIPRGYGGAEDDVEAEAVLAGMEQLVPACLRRETALDALFQRVEGADQVLVAGLPFAGASQIIADLHGGGTVLVDPVLPIHELPLDDDDVVVPAGSALVAVVADEAVLERRARGQRVGRGPLERLSETLGAARERLAGLPVAVTLDNSNALAPLLDGQAPGE